MRFALSEKLSGWIKMSGRLRTRSLTGSRFSGMDSISEPRRGEIWIVSLGAAKKGEPGKNRPAVVMSVEELLIGSDDELVAVVPISASRAKSPLRPAVLPADGIDVESVALPRAIRSVSRRRLLRRIGQVGPTRMAAIEDALRTVLGFEPPAPS